jgi:S-adenosylmethionine/arginine decarboxylase-like enzyme
MLDLHGCDLSILQDCAKQYALLLELPGEIGMTPITAPQIARWDAPMCKDQQEWGYSGTILFAESHAYFHTWPEGRFVLFDLTSCKNFDGRFVTERVKRAFGAEFAIPTEVERGRSYDAKAAACFGAPIEPTQFVGNAGGLEVDVMPDPNL